MRHNLFHVPNVIRQPGLHRGRHAERLVNAAEVVKEGVDRDHRCMAFNLLGEAVGEAREPPNAHTHVEVLPLDMRRTDLRDVLCLRMDESPNLIALDALRRDRDDPLVIQVCAGCTSFR